MPQAHRSAELRFAALLGLAALVCAALALALAAGRAVSPAYGLIALLGAVAVGVLARAVAAGRLLEPLPLVAGVTLLAFVLRPLQLLLSEDELRLYRPPVGSVQALLEVRNQEIARFVTQQLSAPFDEVLVRGLLAVALFFVLFLAGYASRTARDLSRRAGRVAAGADALDLRPSIAVLLSLGLVAQIAVLASLGGPGAAAEGILHRRAGDVGYELSLTAAFPVTALVLWAAFHPPSTGRARLLFGAALADVTVFYLLLGSRALVMMPFFLLALVRHHLYRPWSLRALAAAFLAGLVLSSAYLAVRQATVNDSLAGALRHAPAYVADPRGVVNDNTAFDGLLGVVAIYGVSEPHGNGRSARDAVLSYVPRRLYAGKPEGGDIAFRKLLWGDAYEGGRPYGVIGALYLDFGWAGVAGGGLALGLLARVLLGLVREGAARPGRRLRVALFAMGMLVLYELLIGVWSIALGFLLQLAVPLTLALAIAWRVRWWRSAPRVAS